jgi:hypothetical protein
LHDEMPIIGREAGHLPDLARLKEALDEGADGHGENASSAVSLARRFIGK